MRVIGVDWGEKRIGLAAGESEFAVVRNLPNLSSSGSLKKDAEAISKLASSESAEAVVVGLPHNPLGSDRMEGLCLQLAEHMRGLGLLVFTVDESMSSFEAESHLAEFAVKAAARKKRIDGESAGRILMRFFEEQRTADAGTGLVGEEPVA